MINEKTYKKGLVKIWNDYKGYYDCDGVKSKCEECPLYVEKYDNCPYCHTNVTEIFDFYDILEMWDKKYQKEKE